VRDSLHDALHGWQRTAARTAQGRTVCRVVRHRGV